MNFPCLLSLGRTVWLAAALCVACVLGQQLVLLANPGGGSVQSGSAQISTGPGQVTVNQTSNRAVVNWQSFSIDQGQTTTFVQPGAKSAILNRVTGAAASQLNGNLNANGQVYLVNPNGVVIGKTGRVNTAAFTASTHNVGNAQFMQGGDLTFSGSSAAGVQNLGRIRATDGDVTLIARRVENHGKITARKGAVTLAGGTEVLVKPSGASGANEQRVFIRGGSGSVVNTGTIRATAAELRAAGGNEYALAVNNSGMIRATTADRSGGRIVLKAERGGAVQNSGRLIAGSKATGGRGGSVVVTGGDVRLTSTSRINVSGTGASGTGGTVNIGGGFQGKDSAIANAKTTTVEAGSEILADGDSAGGLPGTGAAGKVVIWSDEHTDFLGSIRTLGKGFVEVSSKGALNYSGSVLTGGGTLLLDPATLEIVAGNSGTLGTSSVLGVQKVVDALAGGDVILDATDWIRVSVDTNANPGNTNDLTFHTPLLYLDGKINLLSGFIRSDASSPLNVYVGASGRIQDGVNAVLASAASIVHVAAATYLERVSVGNKSLTVSGAGTTGSAVTTVDGQSLNSVFTIDALSNAVTLENMVITGGREVTGVYGGGGVQIRSGNVTMNNATITGNSTTTIGGGVYINSGSLVINNSSISQNTAGAAGAVYLVSSTLTMNNSTVSGNWVRFKEGPGKGLKMGPGLEMRCG